MPIPRDIQEWIDEINLRPQSAPALLRLIAERLQELEDWNRELLSDNIQLRSGEKTAELEGRIAALEYQLELLRRLPAAERDPAADAQTPPPPSHDPYVFLFRPTGQVLRLALPAAERWAPLASLLPADPQAHPDFFIAGEHEELLFVFDSGRSLTVPAAEIPLLDPTQGWAGARRLLPRPGEILAAVLPMAGLPLREICVQVSRRACAKLVPQAPFQTAVTKGQIGAGILRKPDQVAFLTLADRSQAVLLFSHQGYVSVLPASSLPYSVEEVMLLNPGDYIQGGFVYSGEAELLFLTQTGKVLRKPGSWLEPSGSFRSRGQPVFSDSRRAAGVRLVGAAALEGSWNASAALLDAAGTIWCGPAASLAGGGAVETGEAEISAAAFLPR